MSEYFAHDELERALGGCRLQSPLGTRNVGGEYDPYMALSTKQKKQLAGAGLVVAAPYGERADVLAGMICQHVATVETTDEALAWFFRMGFRSIEETRQMSHKRRYIRRMARAQERGYPSYHFHRLARTVGLDSYEPALLEAGQRQ